MKKFDLHIFNIDNRRSIVIFEASLLIVYKESKKSKNKKLKKTQKQK